VPGRLAWHVGRMRYVTEPLFDMQSSPLHVGGVIPDWDHGPWVYVCHMFQIIGDPYWKNGHTEASVFVRARQIVCVPVAWWPGTEKDERRCHRMWKKNRVSPAAEFFRHGFAYDKWVRAKILEMPEILQPRQLEIYDQIMERYRREQRHLGDDAA